jgi:hypothetical protein
MYTTDLIDNLDSVLPALPRELDFTPVHEPQTRNGNVIDNAFWVVNPINDMVIGSGKSVHRTANFSTLWDALREGLVKADINTQGAGVKFHALGGGAAMSAEIILKKYDFEKKLGEAAQLRMLVRDSHDQSIKRQVQAMVYRLACLNGMISMRERVGVSEKHTLNADAEVLGKVASEFPARLENEASLMLEMRRIDTDRDQDIDFFRRNVATYKTRTGVKINGKFLERVVGIYDNYRELGQNAYRVYNTLTHLSTHVEAQRDGTEVERKRIRIEQDIEGVIHGEEFRNRYLPESSMLLAA